jgi:hypothetical protein
VFSLHEPESILGGPRHYCKRPGILQLELELVRVSLRQKYLEPVPIREHRGLFQ